MKVRATADPFVIQGRHHLELELGAVRALASDDNRLAFALADRRCRILPLPESQIYLLRAEALQRLGYKAAALKDVSKALDISPDDVGAARRMMSWSAGERQLDAAAAVAAYDFDPTFLKKALAVLRANGRSTHARIEPLDGEVVGWVVWSTPGGIELTMSSPNEIHTTIVSPDPAHRLELANGYAADFRMVRPRSAEPQSLKITHNGKVIATARIPGNEASPSERTTTRNVHAPHPDFPLTVIVPVYADHSATRACLESLLAATAFTPNLKILIVDDASPDHDIQQYLRSIADLPAVTVLSNPTNLGFVGAINRALRATPGGDVILLNADTLVPPGALQRLRTTVAATPQVGTATPLSNNGEFTSFPIPNRSNPLPSLDRVIQLDLLSSEANGNSVVEIPNGIGFCLYITRECLDAVGELSESFHRGYLEDVDLCLRASEAGLRNVCVTGVYVGHEGSRSFKEEKRSLVVRNLRVLKLRYPRYEAECAAFALADPLRRSRDMLERAALAKTVGTATRILLTGNTALRDVAMARSLRLAAEDEKCLIFDFQTDGASCLARITDPQGGIPQSIAFDLSDTVEREALQRFLIALAPEVVEIVEPRKVPRYFVSFMRVQGIRYRILIADGSLALNPAKPSGINPEWRALIDQAESIVAPDPIAEEFATRILGVKVSKGYLPFPLGKSRSHAKGRLNYLGVLIARSSVQEFQFLRSLSLHLSTAAPTIKIVVLGRTLDDLKLMQSTNLFVTGPIESGDIETLLQGHGIGKLLIGTTDPLFGHPLVAHAEAARLPTARLEWIRSTKAARKGDLHIDVSRPLEDIVEAVTRWVSSKRPRHGIGATESPIQVKTDRSIWRKPQV